jgi:hypothetical protein
MSDTELAVSNREDFARVKVQDAVRFICALATSGDPFSAAEIFASKYPRSPHVGLIQRSAGLGLMTRAAIPGGSRLPGSWAGNLPAELGAALVAAATPISLLGRLEVAHVPFSTPIIADDPLTTTVGWTEVGDAKVPRVIVVARLAPLAPATAAIVVVFTEELVRAAAAGALAFVRDHLTKALAYGLDRLFLDPTVAATTSTPASITNGVVPIASTGTPAGDLKSLITGFITGGGNLAEAVLLISPGNAVGLGLPTAGGPPSTPTLSVQGGTVAGLPGLVSAAVGDRLILIDRSRTFLALGDADVALSPHATIEMVDAPGSSSTTPTGAALVSMFQTNSIALRAERLANWATAAGAVGWMDNVNYLA